MNENQIAKNPHESLNEDGPPFEITSGPTEGHEHREVIEDTCGNCGFDRVLLSQKHGEASKRCLLCNSYNHCSVDDTWKTERTDFDELKKLREWADYDGYTVNKIGEYGRSSRYFHGTEVFEHTDTDLLKIFEHPSSTSTKRKTFTRSDLTELLRLLEREEAFVTNFVAEEMDGKQVSPDLGSANPNAVHVGIIKHRHDQPGYVSLRLWIAINRIHGGRAPVHIPADAPGVSV